MSIAVAAIMLAFVFSLAAGAQETTDENAGGAATDTQQPQVFAEGEQTAQAQADVASGGTVHLPATPGIGVRPEEEALRNVLMYEGGR
jgi:L-alanine-DL-glutamate epimerase-like enolase superfamily enzyme